MELNRFEKWMFKRIIKKLVKQGNHRRNVTEAIGLLAREFKLVFTEDTPPSQNAFLQGCLDDALKTRRPK